MAQELKLLQSPFPWCCRYKERGVMFCHDGPTWQCKCHGTLAPPVLPVDPKPVIFRAEKGINAFHQA